MVRAAIFNTTRATGWANRRRPSPHRIEPRAGPELAGSEGGLAAIGAPSRPRQREDLAESRAATGRIRAPRRRTGVSTSSANPWTLYPRRRRELTAPPASLLAGEAHTPADRAPCHAPHRATRNPPARTSWVAREGGPDAPRGSPTHSFAEPPTVYTISCPGPCKRVPQPARESMRLELVMVPRPGHRGMFAVAGRAARA